MVYPLSFVQGLGWRRIAYIRAACRKSRRDSKSKLKCQQSSRKAELLDSKDDDDDDDDDDGSDKNDKDKDDKDGKGDSNSSSKSGPSNNGNNGNNNGGPGNFEGGGPGPNQSNSNGNRNKGGPPNPGRVGCQFVNENDGRLQYTGRWTLETKNPYSFTTTTHTTSSIGSQVAVTFNGSMIIIVGIVHPSNQTVPPATASYTIDDSNSTELPLPVATHDIPNQQFFQSAQLTPAPHTLLINVTSDGSPYTIDYLFVCGTGGPAPPPSSQIPDRPREEFVPKTVAVVVGSILGVVMFTLVIALLYMLWKFRRRRSRQRQPTTTATHRLKEWVRRQTLFTTSESIMRNNPTNPSAADKAGTANRPDDSLSESKSPTLPDVPVYRTFAEFDRGFSFPVTYRLSTQISAQVPFSPNAVDGRHDSSSFHSLPPIPLKDLPNPPSPGRPPLQY